MSDITPLSPADDPWQFSVDEMPTTDDTDDIAARLAARLGMDLPDAEPADDDAPQDGEIEAVLANPPTAGDVMPPGEVDEQDITPLSTPPAQPSPQAAPQAGDAESPQSATAGDSAPSDDGGDLVWTDADPDQPPVTADYAPQPTTDAQTGVIDTYFATAYGETDPRQTIERIEENLAVVRAIEALPPDRQQIIGAILRGEAIDPYVQPQHAAPAPTPTPQPTAAQEYVTVDAFDEWGNPKQFQVPVPATTPAPTAPPQPMTDPRVDALIAQQQAEHQQRVQRDIQSAVEQFRSSHPELSTAEVAQIAQTVTRRNAWAYEAQQGAAVDEAFRRHMEGNLAIDPELSAKSRVAQQATVPPAPTDPQRAARSAAIAGSSAPSTTTRRRSVVGGGTPAPVAPAKNRADLARQIQQAIDGAGGPVAAN